jgi:hypothetical protein
MGVMKQEISVTKDQAQLFMKMLDQHIEDLRHFSLLPQDATGNKFKKMQIDLEMLHASLARDYGPMEARRT